jgi:type II secretory pathway pseudopilin PulG
VHDKNRLADGAADGRAEPISMKIYPHQKFADAKEERRQGERAFTMVEIAIAIGVIGFALVAVIGVLPTGMNVQKDNREDTTISQDAPVFIDAIRNGANLAAYTNDIRVNRGLDFLTNYVEKIMLMGFTNGVTPPNGFLNYANFTSGAQIIGLLSTPNGREVTPSNYLVTRAIVRSLASPAIQQNGNSAITAFRYQMDVEIVPFVNNAPDDTAYGDYTPGTPDYLIRYNRSLEISTNTYNLTNGLGNGNWPTNLPFPLAPGALTYNLFDVRVHFSWPVLPGPNGTTVVGPGRQNYRTMIASQIWPAPVFQLDGQSCELWFFQPQLYATNSGSL